MSSVTTFTSDEALLSLLKGNGHKKSTDQKTTHTRFDKTLEWLFPQGIELTSERDLFVSLEALLEARETLLSTVHGAQAVVSERLNTLRPINNLPVEIFIQILAIASEVNTTRPAEYLSKLLLVCRRWKTIIYGTPILWTMIVPGDNYRCALENSRELPLTVHISSGFRSKSNNTTRRFLHVLEPHVQRLQRFMSDAMNHDVIDRLYPLMKASHTLHVAGKCHPAYQWKLTRSQVPKLRHLSLDHFIVPWGSDLLPGLESLVISRLFRVNQPALEAFAAVLDGCRSLKVLRIQSDERSHFGAEKLDQPKIQLPLLEELSVGIPSPVALPAIIDAPRL